MCLASSRRFRESAAIAANAEFNLHNLLQQLLFPHGQALCATEPEILKSVCCRNSHARFFLPESLHPPNYLHAVVWFDLQRSSRLEQARMSAQACAELCNRHETYVNQHGGSTAGYLQLFNPAAAAGPVPDKDAGECKRRQKPEE